MIQLQNQSPYPKYLTYGSILLEQNFTKVALSIRDPLDISNEDKVISCNVSGGFKCDYSDKIKCEATTILSDINQPSADDKRYYFGTCSTTRH